MAGLGYRLIEGSLRVLGARPETTRTYAAAKTTRLTNDWVEVNSSANQEIKMSLRTMRARARQLARDDDYFKGFLDWLVENVVGQKGIRLEPNARDAEGKKIKAINDPVKFAWAKYSKKQFASVTGDESMRDIQALALRTMAVDGEAIIRQIVDDRNPFRVATQFIDADWLDEDYNDPRDYRTGNRIIMSVEVDAYGKPVAYHLTPPRWYNIAVADFAGNIDGRPKRERVLAHEIIHLFHKTRPNQVRGMTWAHTAMLRLNMLNGYEEAELVGQRVAASVSAYAIPPAPTDVAGTQTPDDIEQEVQAGIIQSLPAGYDLKIFDPKRPGNTYGAYVKQILRAIGRGLGIQYNTLSSDWESTSYSSGRLGSIEDRDRCRGVQEMVAEHLCQDLYERWLMLNLDTPVLPVPFSAFDQLEASLWRGRGWDWVDPLKDGKADIELNKAGLRTKTEIYADRGLDFDEQMEIFAHEREVEESHGLTFGVDHEAMLQMDQLAAQSDADEKAAADKQQKQKAAA
jgi:lambda family phage portal protein